MKSHSAAEATNQRKKEWKENIAIWVSIAAALFAGWSVYEARRAVDAQISATRLDETPFAYVKPTGMTIENDGGSVAAHIRFNLIVVGRTPALNIRLQQGCELTERDAVSLREQQVLEHITPWFYNDSIPMDCLVELPNNEGHAVFMTANLTYSDYFGRSHQATLCFNTYASVKSPDVVVFYSCGSNQNFY